LIDLIKKLWIKLKVFNFTLDEVVWVLNHYHEEKDKFFEWIETNSIYQNFKKLWYTDTNMYRLIAEIDFKVYEKFWIELLNFNTSKLPPTDDYVEIEEFNNKSTYSKEHDQNSIEAIKYLRNSSSPRIIELSKFIFLSADMNLFQADINVNKKSFSLEKIPNVITPQILSNFLWIKSPTWDSNLPIDIVFSSIYSYWLIDQEVWNTFYHNSQELISSWDISEEDFALLVTSNEFKNKLSITQPWKVSKPLIITNIKEQKQIAKWKIKQEVINEVKIKHKNEIKHKNKEKVEEINQDIIKKIRLRCNSYSKKVTIWICILLVLVYFCWLFFIYIFVKDKWDFLEPLVWCFWIWLLPFSYFFRNFKINPYKTIKTRIYKRHLQKEMNYYLE